MQKQRWSRPPQRRLRLYLIEHEISQLWLTEQTGFSTTTICGIVTGRVRPTRRTRALIAEALGQPSGALFEHLEDPTDEELAEAELARQSLPTLDNETIEELRRLLFPTAAARQTVTTKG